MNRAQPSIACIALLGRSSNPLHISLFPPSARNLLEYQLLLHTSLDVFAAILPTKTSGTCEFGLLQAVDERLSMHGWMTNTGVKIVVVVDMMGRRMAQAAGGGGGGGGGGAIGDSISMGGSGSGVGSGAEEVPPQSPRDREAYLLGLRESDLRPAFKAIQKAYVALLKNPFYEPDDHDPVLAMQNAAAGGGGGGGYGGGMEGGLEIRSKRFISEVERVGRMWFPGITVI